jgi:allantoate deiminase
VADLDVEALGRRAEAMVRELATFTATEGQITRLYLTPAHRQAADRVARWMGEAGLAVSEDALGTVRGRLEPGSGTTGPARRLLLGSHIDSVVDAGAYDGVFGVVAAILAAQAIAAGPHRPSIGLDVLAFGDEEGSRFPVTLLCSSLAAGRFDRSALEAVSVDGVRLADALRAYGKDPGRITPDLYASGEALGYVELHIEQGPVLEAAGEALGVVTAIAAQTRLTVTVAGEAGHAGTVPMAMRRDALAAAAEMVGAVEAIGRAGGAEAMVATVGRLQVSPGTSNVIPGHASFSVDLRAASDAARDHGFAALREAIAAIADRRGVGASIETVHQAQATPCDPRLADGLAAAIRSVGGTAPRLASGAGHDGQAMARLCPIGMMFVRCRGGISHNPAEFVSAGDMGLAIAALIRFVRAFVGERDHTAMP